MDLRNIIQHYPLAVFFLLAFGISWGIWIPTQVLFPPTLPLSQREPAQVLAILGTFGPAIAAVIVAWGAGSWPMFKTRLLRWRVAPVWYGIAVGIPVSIGVLTYGVYRLLGGAPFTVSEALPPQAIAVMFVITLVAGGGNEELGWRGFALPLLQDRFGPLSGTLVLLWAGWHLPAFLDPASSQAGVPPVAWLFAVMALTTLLTWLFNQTMESIPVAAVFHVMFNVVLLWIVSGLPVDNGPAFYWTGVVIVVIIALGITILTRGNLGYPSTTDQL